MSDASKEILDSGNPEPDQQRLLDYLTGKLNESENHATEKAITDDAFISDAIDGLEQFDNKHLLQARLDEMNQTLERTLHPKRTRAYQRKIPSQQWALFTIIILLLFAIVGYIILKKISI